MRILLVMALLTACAPPAPWKATPAFFAGIGRLEATAGGYGTAFPTAHTEDGFIVMTCAHVVRGAVRFTFRLPGKAYPGGQVIWKSPGEAAWGSSAPADCALVRFKSTDRPKLYRISQGRGEALKTGWVAGWPSRTDKLHINTVIFQVERRRLDASVAPGSSGSPVFNAQGEVVGLISLGRYPLVQMSVVK